MVRRSIVRVTIFSLIVLLSISLFWGCNSDSSSIVQEYGAWHFSGYVVDGYSENALTNVTIAYKDSEGESQVASVGTDGSFFIKSLPYGERSFSFSYGTEALYTKKVTVVGAWQEATQVEGAVGDLSKVIKLYPLTASLTGTIHLEPANGGKAIPLTAGEVKVAFSDTSMAYSTPSLFSAPITATGSFTLAGLPATSGGVLEIAKVLYQEETYGIAPISLSGLYDSGKTSLGNIYLTAEDSVNSDINLVSSNVLSKDGLGLVNIPVTVTPTYTLPITPNPSSVSAKITGTTETNNRVVVKGDTVTVFPAMNLDFDSTITVTLTGSDTAGNKFNYSFAGEKAFSTEQGMYITNSNYWDKTGAPVKRFQLLDTIWVTFSEELDTNLNNIIWFDSAGINTIYGSGANTNAIVSVSGDTLFIVPDQRLSIDYGESVGFSVSLLSLVGKRSKAFELEIDVIDDNLQLLWTNTKDHMGNSRVDLGVLDSIIVVANKPITEVLGLSKVPGKTLPPDLMLDNISLSGDTISYKPSLFMNPDSLYGLSFDVLLADGTKRYGILPVEWEVMNSVKIIRINNREKGKFRTFKSLGDSLVVTFSSPIDTNISAQVPFTVHMLDVNDKAVTYRHRWDPTLTTVTIYNTRPLPTADFSESISYDKSSKYSRAIETIAFDFITTTGEVVRNLTPRNDLIEIHTESGICAVDANILTDHNLSEEISTGASTVTDFPVDGILTVQFNRAVDTTKIRTNPALYFGIDQKGTTKDSVTFTLSFSEEDHVIAIKPDSLLVAGTGYYLWGKNIPAAGISEADAIHFHSGTFSGSAISDRLVTSSFTTEE